MHVSLVSIRVNPDDVQDFIAATRLNQESSVQEDGNLRFDFLQSMEDPCVFLLYEAYRNEDAALRHKRTEHYLIWRDTVAAWMAAPRTGTPYRALSPMEQ